MRLERGAYGVDDPRGTVPRGRVEGCPEIEEKDGSNATAVELRALWVILGLCDLDVPAHDPQTD